MSSFQTIEEKHTTKSERFNSEGISSNDFVFFPNTGVAGDFEESFSSDYIPDSKELIQIDPEYLKKHSSKLSQKIYRTHYSKEIISSIEWLTENHISNEPLSINCIAKLLLDIKEFINDSPRDPFGSFLLALYDGLSYKESWLSLEKNSYKQIGKFLKDMTNQELNYKKVDKYISKLDKLGLNVLPY